MRGAAARRWDARVASCWRWRCWWGDDRLRKVGDNRSGAMSGFGPESANARVVSVSSLNVSLLYAASVVDRECVCRRGAGSVRVVPDVRVGGVAWARLGGDKNQWLGRLDNTHPCNNDFPSIHSRYKRLNSQDLPDRCIMSPATLLSLPQELLDLIYEFVAINDIDAFADLADAHFRRPTLLAVNKRISQDYADVFFQRIIMDSWWSSTGVWCNVHSTAAKKDIFVRAGFADLSCNNYLLAGAQRHCQARAHRWPDGQSGLLTIVMNGCPRYWTWRKELNGRHNKNSTARLGPTSPRGVSGRSRIG